MLKPILTLSFLLFFGIGLYAQPKAVGEPRVIAKTNEPLEKPAWSSDGKTLYFTSLRGEERWKVSIDGTNLKRVTDQASIQRKANSNSLLQHIISDPANVASQVKGLESLSGYILFNPALSPKGDQIVFQAGKGKGMFVCNADGSGLRSLGADISRATWAPDGKYIVAMKIEDDGHVITKGELISIEVATGTKAVFLSSDKYIALSPAISPDGKKLAFEDYAGGAVYVMDIQQ